MAGVRVLVATAKGAFVLRADEDRTAFEVDGPFFGGWQVMHVQGSPADPDRLWAAVYTDWHGQVIHRSDDGGRTWATVGNELLYDGGPDTHPYYDGTPRPWAFQKVWHLAGHPTDRDTVYAGVEDAGLFRSTDGGDTWHELTGLRAHPSAPTWQPGGGGLCLHTIIIDPNDPDRLFVAISAAGVLRSTDGGATFELATRGLRSEELPTPEHESGHCVHKLAMHPDRPDTLFMQKHWDVCRTDDGGEHWTEVSGDLPSDFGFPVVVHPHQPETIYVVPITSDTEHYPPDGALKVARSRTGGGTWELLTEGLPQHNAMMDVLRDCLAIDGLASPGLYLGTTTGTVFASNDEGETWRPAAEHLPRIHAVEVQTLA